jgi:hypothetical protein
MVKKQVNGMFAKTEPLVARHSIAADFVDPINKFCGAATPKNHVSGTHRVCEPAETWNRIAPHLTEFGITRVGDILFDRIGIPIRLQSTNS